MDQSPDSLTPELQALANSYACMNKTELYQRCRRAGLPVQPGWAAENYVAVLLGAQYSQETEHVIDALRDSLICFIGEYWQQLQAILKCPAKNLRHADSTKADARPCYKCLDMQAVGCIVGLSPSQQQVLYQLRRRNT